ncbi:uncharacterized protein amer3 [Amia ocellicauda]|uniref:uncharacterized protein amer3 n=1 Tax=Amia ocellicauda TaxID=2972642 RepID=UPI003463FBFE
MEPTESPPKSSLQLPKDQISPTVDVKSGEHVQCLQVSSVACNEASSRGGEDSSKEGSSGVPTSDCGQGWGHSQSVRKSKTHDCVVSMGLQPMPDSGSSGESLSPSAQRRGRLVSSVSFSGFGISSDGYGRLMQENRGVSGYGRQIIDYRDFTPQVPFVPSIAKSIPRKRISLRKPRKAFRDLFGMKRHKHEKAASPVPLDHGPGGKETASKESRKSSKHRERSTGNPVPPELSNSDLLSDSSNECYGNFCEDVASLKSFDSQAGCGEIFADEEQHISLGIERRQDPDKDVCEPRKPSPVGGSFQGGVEQLASPHQTEVMDFLGIWDGLGRTVLLRQNSRTERKVLSTQSPTQNQPASQNLGASPSSLPTPAEEEMTVDLNADVTTPKSENQSVSTSDEGYYDSFSPGQEDNSRGSITPCGSSRFPRDSYSGDALYELFYDPNETGITPIFDDDMSLSESDLGQSSDLPLSMYSFHVGAEENLAPPLALDVIGQELLQSNWKGKECLLKLCDTEISLAMGIVNWLKHRTEKLSPSEAVCNGTEQQRNSGCLNGEVISPVMRKVPRKHTWSEHSDSSKHLSKERPVCSQNGTPVSGVVPFQLSKDRFVSALSECNASNGHGEAKFKTATNGRCLKIFSDDHSFMLNKDIKLPSPRTPGTGANAIILLAINKESLCESCRASLKHSSKELLLCASCLSFIEHIKTSELLNCAADGFKKSVPVDLKGTHNALPLGIFESPISPSRGGGDLNLMNLLEQCVGQVSSLKINGSVTQELKDSEPFFLQFDQNTSGKKEKDLILENEKDQIHRFLKPKKNQTPRSMDKRRQDTSCHSQTKGSTEKDTGTLQPEQSNVQDLLPQQEGGGLEIGLVTTNSSDELVLETYWSPSSDKSRSDFLGDTYEDQPLRPTFLPLSNSAFSEFTSSQKHTTGQHGDGNSKGQQLEKVRRHRKLTVNRDGPCGYVMAEEKKEEWKRRIKK